MQVFPTSPYESRLQHLNLQSIEHRRLLTDLVWCYTRSSATAEKQRVSCPHGGG